jgi:triacylglycerol lipase
LSQQVLTPSQIYSLCNLAYEAKSTSESGLSEEISQVLPALIDKDSVVQLNATSGALISVQSGFGFVARGVGARQNEVFLATRGTASLSDAGTDLNFFPTENSVGGQVHRGFKNTFDSYASHLNQLIKKAMPKGRPTRIHCMGHSLGGALANLNAAVLADQGHNVNLYTLASPRVGMTAFAEHLAKKISPSNVYRVAHLADPVAMVPCFPFLHGPLSTGHINLERSHLSINPKVHMMTVGYKSLQNQSWKQLKADSQLVQSRLEAQVESRHSAITDFQTNISPPQLTMHSIKLLKYVGFLINDLLDSQGRRGMLTAQYWHTGAFTTLDQLAEAVYLCSLQGKKAAEQTRNIVLSIQRFLGYPRAAARDVTRSLLVQTFKMLKAVLQSMVRLALGR